MRKFTFLKILIICFIVTSCNYNNNISLNPSAFSNKKYLNLSREKKINYLDSIYFLSTNKNIANITLNRKFLCDLALEFSLKNEFEKSLIVCKKTLKLSLEKNDTLNTANTFLIIGNCLEDSKKDSAYYYYHQAEKLFRINKNHEKLGRTLYSKAGLLFDEGNYLESEIQTSKALTILKNTSKKGLIFYSYNLLGQNFEKLGEYKDALKYYNLAGELLLQIKKESPEYEKKFNPNFVLAINKANVYEDLKQYDNAIRELRSEISDSIKKIRPIDYSLAVGNLGSVYLKKGDFKQAKSLFIEELNIATKNDSDTYRLYGLKNLGEYYSAIHDTTQSIRYLQSALQLAEKLKSGEDIKNILYFLSKTDSKNSAKYQEQYILVNDSLSKIQRANRNKFARIEYETSVIEDENKVLTQKNLLIVIISLISILSLISIVIIRYIKSQKREIAFRQQQQLAEEEIFELLKEHQIKLSQTKELEQNRISRELHDSVMNKIYSVRFQLGILNDSDTPEIKEKRLNYVDLLQNIEKEIRDISHDLHTDDIENQFDYINLLNNLISQQNDLEMTLFSFKQDETIDWNAISGLVKITIYRIIQEALLNVIKYAEATTCIVTISKNNSELQLRITDNGKGFDTSTTDYEGIGFKNIRQRIKNTNARLSIKSKPEKGTTIKVFF